jgi:hypothetical protein
VTNKPPTDRRAWRTNDEWARLRERITAGDLTTPARTRCFAAGRARWMVAAAVPLVFPYRSLVMSVALGASCAWITLRLARCAHSDSPAGSRARAEHATHIPP